MITIHADELRTGDVVDYRASSNSPTSRGRSAGRRPLPSTALVGRSPSGPTSCASTARPDGGASTAVAGRSALLSEPGADRGDRLHRVRRASGERPAVDTQRLVALAVAAEAVLGVEVGEHADVERAAVGELSGEADERAELRAVDEVDAVGDRGGEANDRLAPPPTMIGGIGAPSTTAIGGSARIQAPWYGWFCQIARRQAIVTRRCSRRTAAGAGVRPIACCSTANGLVPAVPEPTPHPAPTSARDCSVLIADASCAGWRLEALATSTPSPMRSVIARDGAERRERVTAPGRPDDRPAEVVVGPQDIEAAGVGSARRGGDLSGACAER